MTDGCGAIMYARTSGKRSVYVCGRYSRSAGSDCENNTVDGEALLKLTFSVIQQVASAPNATVRLREALRRRAEADASRTSQSELSLNQLEARRKELGDQRDTASSRMAREQDDDRYQAIAKQFDQISAELKAVDRAISQVRRTSGAGQGVDEAIAASMSLLQQLANGRDRGGNAARSPVGLAFGRL